MPELPQKDQKLRVIIDTDFANEIDDMYVVALALVTPERFEIEGFITTHFNNSSPDPESIQKSYALLTEFLEVAGLCNKYKVVKSAPPISLEESMKNTISLLAYATRNLVHMQAGYSHQFLLL